MSRRKKIVAILGLLSIVMMVVVFSQGGVASSHSDIIEDQIETEYNGVGEGDQAITTVATFEAQQEIDQLRIGISESSDTLVDYESIEPSVQGEGVDVNSENGRSQYVVDNLESGQAVTLEFNSYPRSLDESELNSAVIQLDAENPRTLDYSIAPTTDTSSSPVLELQRTQDQLATVQGDLNQMKIFDTVGIVGVVLGLIVGLGGIGAAVVFKRKESEWKGEAYADAANHVRRFQQGVNFSTNSVEQECRELISTLERKPGDGGTNTTVNTGTDTDDTGSDPTEDDSDIDPAGDDNKEIFDD